MRVFVLVTILLASASLYPTFAQEEGKAPVAAPQTVPAQTDQSSQQPQQDQRNGGDQPKTDNREVGRDWRMRPGEGDRMGRDDREMGRDWRMHRDREAGRDRNMDRGRYGERGGRDQDRDRDRDRAERDRDSRSFYDDDRSRRRMKLCVEYENGEEYCRYRD